MPAADAAAAAADDVLIAIVNYRTADLVIDCLASLEGEVAAMARDGVTVRTVVVDNASGDGSADKIAAAIAQRGWGTWAEALPLDRNAGFAGGNNAAIRPALASPNPPGFVLLLNPDTVVRPGAVAEMRRFLVETPAAGIVGCRLDAADGTPQCSAFRFPGVLSELERGARFGPVSWALSRFLVAPPWQGGQPYRTDWVSGAAMMIRRAVFDSVGLMDEGYFLYFEELDFCLAAARAGWERWFLPSARITHLEGQASGIGTGIVRPKRTPRYWFESRRRYYLKNHGRAVALLADAAFALGHASWRLRRFVQRRPDTDPPHHLADFVKFSFVSPGVFA
jgi:GT2 family glycosyltransferase